MGCPNCTHSYKSSQCNFIFLNNNLKMKNKESIIEYKELSDKDKELIQNLSYEDKNIIEYKKIYSRLCDRDKKILGELF